MSYESFPRPVACMLACIKLGSHYSFVLVLLTGNDKIKNNRVLSMVVIDEVVWHDRYHIIRLWRALKELVLRSVLKAPSYLLPFVLKRAASASHIMEVSSQICIDSVVTWCFTIGMCDHVPFASTCLWHLLLTADEGQTGCQGTFVADGDREDDAEKSACFFCGGTRQKWEVRSASYGMVFCGRRDMRQCKGMYNEAEMLGYVVCVWREDETEQ